MLQRFQADCAAGRPDSAIECWLGPPADGLSLDDAPAFNDWWAPERERLLGLRRGALAASAAAHEARGDLAAALQRIDSLLADDPLQEQHHRDAMRLLAASGRREAALAQFERCTALLRGELGLEPMAETGSRWRRAASARCLMWRQARPPAAPSARPACPTARSCCCPSNCLLSAVSPKWPR
jgi:DNA-binding SARP family transcriptional activator